MTNQEAIEILEGLAVPIHAEAAFDMAIEALKKQKEQRWIPVSERLPEEDKDVLVSVHFLGHKLKHKSGWIDHIKECYYTDIASQIDGDWSSQIDGDWSSASDEYNKVIAWRPLPEPYKEKMQQTCDQTCNNLQPVADDLISRQAAIDALEREQSLVERPITEIRWFDLGLRKAQDVLSRLPSVQPEIIRCKDCKHFGVDRYKKLTWCSRIDYGYGYQADDFCSKAERRTDE